MIWTVVFNPFDAEAWSQETQHPKATHTPPLRQDPALRNVPHPAMPRHAGKWKHPTTPVPPH